jgi:ubiquinone/menaquinone biosynthesis C-methylase UbiE
MTTTTSTPAPGSAEGLPGAPSPGQIMRLATGFMSAKHLFAASELGLFEALADSPATIEALAARTGLTRRAARISADAMTALGLLERSGDLYRNSDTAAVFLAGATPADLRPFLRFWDKISFPAWAGLADALASGPARQITEVDDALQEVASAGIEAIVAGPAAALAQAADFSDRGRLLDIGGGTGSWSIAVAEAHPHMAATVVELPAVAEIARNRIAAAGLGSRVAVTAGDAMQAPLPEGYDTCLVANLVHYFSAEENQHLLSRVRGAVGTGARLLLADFWTDPTHTEPLIAALMAGEFAVHIRHGDVYSVEEARRWLTAAGWKFTGHQPLAGPFSLVAAEAV